MPPKVFRSSTFSAPFIFGTVILTLTLVIGCQQSATIPAEIVGDSMAPLLCGKHLSPCCPQCDFAFVCRAGRDIETLHCPNCGATFSPPGQALPPDRVQVIPNQAPQRWDIVAFEHNGNTMIKRVVGLPGESINIAGGNIFIDDQLIAKPKSVSSQTKHLVYDSAFQSQATPARLEFNADDWSQESGALFHNARTDAEEAVDWISYRHQRAYPHHAAMRPPAWPAIEDDNSFNQNVGRKLNPVNELEVRLELTLELGARFEIQHIPFQNVVEPTGPSTHFIRLSVDQNLLKYDGVFTNGVIFSPFSGTLDATAEGNFKLALSFSNIDGRIQIRIDEDLMVDVAEEVSRPLVAADPESPFLKFGFHHSSTGTVNRCRIWRDIYYFAQPGPPKRKLPTSLGRGEYFVLGDNVAVSRDSRHFGPIKKVIGIVK